MEGEKPAAQFRLGGRWAPVGLALATIVCLRAVVGQNDASGPPTEVCSADKKYCVRMIEIPHHADECRLRVSANTRTIAEFPTFGYLLDALFSPDNSYVAINNRRANSGDYLWVISLHDGRAIKMPDDVADELSKEEVGQIKGDHPSNQSIPEIIALSPNCTTDFVVHAFVFARDWKSSNELRVVEEVECPEGWIAANKICRIVGKRLALVEQTVEKKSRPSELVRQAWTWSPFHSD